MRDVLRFILNHIFVILFVLLEIFSVYLLVNQNDYQRFAFVNAFIGFKGRVHNATYSFRQYKNLRQENYDLVQENIQLRGLLKENYQTSIKEFISINDSVSELRFNYYDAKIINNSVNKQHNYITLNKGSRQGIEPEMGVISSKGVVGIVRSVSNNFSSVISVLNKDFRLSAKIKRNGYFGSLQWDGKDYRYAILNEIPYHVQLIKGDTIITSGFSTIFPEGFTVGTIEEFEVKDGNFYQIKVHLSNDFKQLSDVYTIINKMKEEQTELEKSIITND